VYSNRRFRHTITHAIAHTITIQSMTHTLTLERATRLAVEALTASGAARAAAESLARATIAAHARGRTNVGFEHLPAYCEALRRGAIDGRAEPEAVRVKPGLLEVDARCGLPQHAFDRALGEFTSMAESQGVAMLTIRNAYTCGELGYFPERLARLGLVAIAAANAGPAAVAPSGSTRAIFSTNPLAYAFPRDGRPPLLVDQSSSACTLVDVHAARDRGEPIPAEWALDRDGRPTTDPNAALAGSFKPFGGGKGSNIALLVELLAAGLGGGNWSIDAPSFAEGAESPGVGLWILAVHAGSVGGRPAHRIDDYLARIASLGAYIPGESRQERAERRGTEIELADDLYRKIRHYCSP
jgi:(2R)-3-sulfolactate dehydrogenase (NADP+)